MARIANRVIVICGEGQQEEYVYYLLRNRLDGVLVVGAEHYQRVAAERGEMIVRAVVAVPDRGGVCVIPIAFSGAPVIVYDPVGTSGDVAGSGKRLTGRDANPANLLACCQMALERRRRVCNRKEREG